MQSLTKFLLAFSLSVAISFLAPAQTSNPFDHVEPPFWWVGMKNNSLQILLHNQKVNIADYQVTLKYDGVVLKEIKKVENPHYLFVTLELTPSAKAGKIPLQFTSGRRSFTYPYELKEKSGDTNRIRGFNSSDVVYLIMPDRFANGDPKNDSIPGMFEGAHRDKDGARHGGDLKGISDHLDYIKDLGVTAMWLNPVL